MTADREMGLKVAALGEVCIQQRLRCIGQRGAAGEGHGNLQFVAQQAQHMRHTGGAGIGQAPDGRAPHQHR